MRRCVLHDPVEIARQQDGIGKSGLRILAKQPLRQNSVEGRLIARGKSEKRDDVAGIARAHISACRPECGGAACPARHRRDLRKNFEMMRSIRISVQPEGGKSGAPIQQWRRNAPGLGRTIGKIVGLLIHPRDEV